MEEIEGSLRDAIAMTFDDAAPPTAGGADDGEGRMAGAVTGGIARGGSGRLTAEWSVTRTSPGPSSGS